MGRNLTEVALEFHDSFKIFSVWLFQFLDPHRYRNEAENFELIVKFMFSKKATKIDEIFTVNLTLCSKCQPDQR